MRLTRLGAAGLIAALSLGAGSAWAESRSEVESARANARAGGPTNAHDAQMLRRWGALSGTGDWRKRWLRIKAEREGWRQR